MMKDVKGANIVITLSSEQSFKMLGAKRFGVDYAAVYTSGIDFLTASKKNNLRNIRFAGIGKRNLYYVVFDKKTVSQELVMKFNQVLIELYNSGEMKRIYSKYKGDGSAALPEKKSMVIPN